MHPQLRSWHQRLSPAQQEAVSHINFLAEELRAHLLLEQFYLGFEILTDAVQQLHPSIPCRSGCSTCCEQGPPLQVTALEWELMRQALSDLPEPQFQAIVARVEAYQASQPCPLLEQGRCSVYALRPFHCRAMGYCTTQVGETRLPMTCAPEQQRIQRALQGPFPSPAFMFLPQAEALSAQIRAMEPQMAPLIDWLNRLRSS